MHYTTCSFLVLHQLGTELEIRSETGGRYMCCIFALVFSAVLNPFRLFPDSTEMIVVNNIPSLNIVSVHYLPVGSDTICRAFLPGPISPGCSTSVIVPFRYMNRIVFGTDAGINHRKALGYTPDYPVDVITVSRADREFGSFFDVIIGSRPHVITNGTPVPISVLCLIEDNGGLTGLLGRNLLMTEESMVLWMDADSISLIAQDVEGFLTDTVKVFRTGDTSVTIIGIEHFLGRNLPDTHVNVGVVNCVNGESMKEILIFPQVGPPQVFDLSSTPLGLWQIVTIPYAGIVDFVVGTDLSGRTYSVESPDEHTGLYVIDWWHLDFDFSFSGGR